jgi:hypothetical protein
MSQSLEPMSSVYRPGAVFQLYTQKPPAVPLLPPYFGEAGLELEQTLGRLQNCHLHNVSPPSELPPSLSVTLSSPFAVGIRERITQVWKVTGSSGPLTARFYDPLYFEDPDGLVDPFISIDLAVASETAAYNQLQQVQGDVVPQFYGLFLCPIPSQRRSIYVVLLEYIHGEDLATLRDGGLCSEHRNAIRDAASETWARVKALGVHNFDSKPRNFILRPTEAKEVGSTTSDVQSNAAERRTVTCLDPKCTLHLREAIKDANMVMIDLEHVMLIPQHTQWDPSPEAREARLIKSRPGMIKREWMDS